MPDKITWATVLYALLVACPGAIVAGMGYFFSIRKAKENHAQTLQTLKADLAVAERRHVLIIEDDPLDMELSKSALVSSGFLVDGARTGQEGLELLESNRGKYLVLLLDLKLIGGMDGCEVIRRMRKTDPWLPVVILSGITTDIIGPVDSYYGVMHKPLNADKINEIVTKHRLVKPS